MFYLQGKSCPPKSFVNYQYNLFTLGCEGTSETKLIVRSKIHGITCPNDKEIKKPLKEPVVSLSFLKYMFN